jgi:hypothetical protein
MKLTASALSSSKPRQIPVIVLSLLIVVPPMIWIQNQLVGAQEGQQMTLECHSEAYPKSINYWTRGQGEIIAQGKIC